MRDETTFNFSGPFRDIMPLYIKYRLLDSELRETQAANYFSI